MCFKSLPSLRTVAKLLCFQRGRSPPPKLDSRAVRKDRLGKGAVGGQGWATGKGQQKTWLLGSGGVVDLMNRCRGDSSSDDKRKKK